MRSDLQFLTRTHKSARTHCIYILVMWQMLLTKGLVLYGGHIFRGGRYQYNKRQQGRKKNTEERKIGPDTERKETPGCLNILDKE